MVFNFVPETPEEKIAREERLLALPGFVVLVRKPGENDYRGLIEHSFSLGESNDSTQFFWSSNNASSNLGGTFKIDGKKGAEERVDYYKLIQPDWSYEIFDAKDEDKLPVILDWQSWLDANAPADTLSGVRNKHKARNIFFRTKE